jgi:RHS repeat-associated protein
MELRQPWETEMRFMAWMLQRSRGARALGTALLTAAITVLAGAAATVPTVSQAASAGPVLALATLTGIGDGSAAGRTPGTFGVSQSGAATYHIPIWTPPGVGAVELGLSLDYSSRNGNGTLGVGWTLSGLSSIGRCNRTVAQDGAAGGVTNTLVDRYCLDGQQLKLVSGSPGSDGAVYATEIESFSRIVANGAAGNGPLSFTVTTRNGLIYEYGTTADARVSAGGSDTIRTWALSRIRDRAGAGNSITLAYTNGGQTGAYSDGALRIVSITYPTTATGAGPFYRVDFTYALRATGDSPVGYRAGAVVREGYQLQAIRASAIGATTPIKTYALGYETAPTTGRLRLASVQECGASTCMRPTRITYQDGATGWETWVDTGVAANAAAAPIPLELNGDGIVDLLYPVSAGSGRLAWRILLGSVNGFGAPFDTGIVLSTTSRILPGQFAGNGRTQFLVSLNGYWHVAGYTDSGFSVVSTGLAAAEEYGAVDYDGDGLADLLGRTGSPRVTVSVRRNVTVPTDPAAGVRFAAAEELLWTAPIGRQSVGWENLRIADVNGDGRADVVALTNINRTQETMYFSTALMSNGFGKPPTVGSETIVESGSRTTMGDWNADGCSDVLQLRNVYVSNCAGGFRRIETAPTPPPGDPPYTVIPADWNADGRTDLLYVDGATRRWFVIASTGDGAAAPVNTGIRAPTSTVWFDFDADGDGLTDLGYRDGNNGNRLRYYLHASPSTVPDLARSFTDGMGQRQQPAYVSIARGNYARRTDAVFPAVDFQGALQVVSEFSGSDGLGGNYRNAFQYAGAQLHLQGRGFMGFASQRIQDTRSGLITVDVVARAFPHTGMHVERSVYQSNGVTPLSSWIVTPGQQVLGSLGFDQRWLPQVTSRTDKRFELGGALNGTVTSESTSNYTYGDGYGNATQVVTSVTDRDPASAQFNAVWTTRAVMAYANDASARWCLGLPASATITHTAPGQAAMTRTTGYAVDTTACRITQQVVEPNLPALKVVSNYGYDRCGNLSSISTVGAMPDGAPMQARSTTFDYGTRCQLPETVTNALGESTRYQWRYDFGVAGQSTDPNGLTTAWTHDDFGRTTGSTAPDGSRQSWTYQSCDGSPCWGASDLQFAVFERRFGADGLLVREQHAYFDGFERLKRHEYHGALGAWLRRTITYDAQGRRIQETLPYSTLPQGHTARAYDALGRMRSVRSFDASGVITGSIALDYAGRTVLSTDSLGRQTSRAHDVGGRLRRVTDPSPGGTTRYDYDSLGNLNRIQSASGAISTGVNNVRGFRTQWTDADGGSWSHAYNSLGQRVGWTDGKGQSFTASYDELGRLVSRTEPEGTSTWTWGTSAAARNVGQLRSRGGLGFAETRTYDALGRLGNRTITTDQSYQYDYTYNTQGEVETIAYPASPVPTGKSGSRLRVRYGYAFGSLSQIDDVTDPLQARALWQLGAVNDFDSPVQEQFAAGAFSRTSGYEPATGRRATLQTGTAGAPGNRQNLSYRWDTQGNLLQRTDLNQSVSETFAYDGLDRLATASLNGATTLSVGYDASGNVRSKSDVGTYVYGDAQRPHAVTGAGGESFTYDRNGNLSTRNGLAQDWASFNLPTTLRKPGYQSQFAYGPDRERWRQVATYQNGTETTHYVGSLLEKEAASSTGLTYWRHYVPTPGGATVVVSRNSDGSASTTYVLPDHLGSSDTLLSETGATRSKLSFSAFGNRRGSNWSSGTAPDWLGIANTTRQGYTGHEAIDNLGLVHMNGRVYDPTLGRFMSPDPLIGDPTDSQSVNPYAYVGNRPLNSIDPTGYASLADLPVGIPGLDIIGYAQTFYSLVKLLFWQDAPPPPATAVPGQSAQNGTGLCGPGTFSPVCGGRILYAGAPAVEAGTLPTSTWGATSVDDVYARDNLEEFFVDLGVNAVDVLILSTVRSAQDAYEAARDGDYVMAAVYAGTTICDVVKACDGVSATTKGLREVAKRVGPLKTRAKESAGAAGNLIPAELARVVAGTRPLTTLGRSDAQDVFVVAADDIAGMNAAQLSKRLTIGASDSFTVIRFPTPSTGLASPVFRSNPGFLPGGLTRGGAREFVIPNGPIPPDSVITVVGP